MSGPQAIVNISQQTATLEQSGIYIPDNPISIGDLLNESSNKSKDIERKDHLFDTMSLIKLFGLDKKFKSLDDKVGRQYKLSGGEFKMLSLIKSLQNISKDTKILIIDEADSGLESSDIEKFVNGMESILSIKSCSSMIIPLITHNKEVIKLLPNVPIIYLSKTDNIGIAS